MAAEALRFVVLRHETREGVHWDLMLERGAGLATWRLEAAPSGEGEAAIAAERIGEHRREYLEYEGAVSGDRGTVRRYDAGLYRLASVSETDWELVFEGRVLRGRYGLSAKGLGSPSAWVLRRF